MHAAAHGRQAWQRFGGGANGCTERARRRAEQGAVARGLQGCEVRDAGRGMGGHGEMALKKWARRRSGGHGERGCRGMGSAGVEEGHSPGRDRRHTVGGHSGGVGIGRDAHAESMQRRGWMGRERQRGHGRGCRGGRCRGRCWGGSRRRDSGVGAGQDGGRARGVDAAARRDRAGVAAHRMGGVDLGRTGARRRGWGVPSGGSGRCAQGMGSGQGKYWRWARRHGQGRVRSGRTGRHAG
jgi:hypothetical protein